MLPSNTVLLLSCALMKALFVVLCTYKTEFKVKEETLLVIGVLSAQNNSAARNSIRQTWKSLTVDDSINFFFLVGIEMCPIHPQDRKSEYSCELLALPLSSSPEPFWIPDVAEYHEDFSKLWISSYTFRVNFPVICRGIRVWKGAVLQSEVSNVYLKNARTGKLIRTMPISQQSMDGNAWHEVYFEPVLLPKSFDAEVQFISGSKDTFQGSFTCFGVSSWLNANGSIEFTSFYGPAEGWSAFNKDTCSPVSLLLELNDFENYIQDRENRNLQWQKQVTSLSAALQNEATVEGDILFLEVLDVYKNIPEKLIQFYRWTYENINFSYLLKTDDDTFIDVPVIEQYLQSLMSTEEHSDASYMWWWGKLRFGLPVERHGKWQELEYAAPVYPPFPCGGGYVLNKNIVEFLVKNSKWLHRFQGEDTALGIWVSGIHPNSPKNPACHWTCGEECQKISCSRGQLSVDDMRNIWQQYEESRKVC